MKRIFLSLCVMTLMGALSASGYTLYVNGQQFTHSSGSKTISTGGGTVTYNATTCELIIENVVCSRSGSDKNGIDSDVGGLVVRFNGTNSFTTANADCIRLKGQSHLHINGSTTFKCTDANQYALRSYNGVSLQGNGTLTITSTAGTAICGENGNSNVSQYGGVIFAVNYTQVSSAKYDLKDLSSVVFSRNTDGSTTTNGITKSSTTVFKAHTSSSYPHASNIYDYTASGTSVKVPTYEMPLSNLTSTTYATQEIGITDEKVADGFYAVDDCIYGTDNLGQLYVAGPSIPLKYGGTITPTFLGVKSFVTINGTMRQATYLANYAFSGLKNIKTVRVSYGIQNLSGYAFNNLANLEEITIPSSVTTIGENFLNLSGTSASQLDVYIANLNPGGITVNSNAFKNTGKTKTSLHTWFSTAAAITSAGALSNYTTYSTVQKTPHKWASDIGWFMGDNYYVITKAAASGTPGEMALVNTEKADLTLTSQNDNYTITGSGTYYCTTVAQTAFLERTDINSVNFTSNNLRTIGARAFRNCTNISSVTLPNYLETIEMLAFAPTAIASITIPEKVKSVGAYAFEDCSKLQQIFWNATYCNNFTSDGVLVHQFKGCPIKAVTFGNKVQYIPANMCRGLSGISALTIPASVNSIGAYAFSGCTGLQVVYWNPTTFADFSSGKNPFNGLSKIFAFNFANNVTRIPAYICQNMTGITRLDFPKTLTEIGTRAFSNCSGVKDIYVAMAQPQNLTYGNFIFEGVDKVAATVHATEGNEAIYRATYPWSEFFQGLTGDVNGDGSVNAADVTALYNYILNGDTTFLSASDVNGDGSVNAGDVTAVYNIILGL